MAVLPAVRASIEMPTVAWFAGLEPSWAESVDSGHDRLVARIHPRHVRDRGDELVLARALTCQGGDVLRRLTIRAHTLVPPIEDCSEGTANSIAAMYRNVLLAICRLPVIELVE